MLIYPVSGDEIVHLRPLLEHTRNAHDKRMEHRGLVIRMLRVFLFEIFKKLRRVKGVVQVHLAVCAVGHDVAHYRLKSRRLSYPACVASVAASSLFLFCITHCYNSPFSRTAEQFRTLRFQKQQFFHIFTAAATILFVEWLYSAKNGTLLMPVRSAFIYRNF